MNSKMENLQPQALWRQFAALCRVPHPSGHLDAIRRYVVEYGQQLGLETDVDSVGNVLIRKPATEGYEQAPGIVLEAHLDMVPQSESDVAHQFQTDPICPIYEASSVNSPWSSAVVKAQGTTLGADNGIGVSAMLAVLADESLCHPMLECLFTVDEETGMTGVNHLDTSWLKGQYLINLDTETEGVLMVGCAGAVDMEATFKYRMDKHIPEGDVAIDIRLDGLLGGHSGMDIHLGRANACKLMCRFLKHSIVSYEARLASFCSGTLRNAIPRTAQAVITVPSEIVDDVLEEIAYYQELFRYEYRNIEPHITFHAQVTTLPSSLLPEEIQDDVINTIEACHDGVLRMSPEYADVVETSSNLACVETTDEETRVVFLIRSMNEEMKHVLASRLQSTFLLGGARVDFSAAYPGWELTATSPLLAQAKTTYQNTFGIDPQINCVHCGLECGIIAERYPQMDIISFGPTIHYPHSPQECVEVESVSRFWQFLTALLASVKA